jgi:hypothetical protein
MAGQVPSPVIAAMVLKDSATQAGADNPQLAHDGPGGIANRGRMNPAANISGDCLFSPAGETSFLDKIPAQYGGHGSGHNSRQNSGCFLRIVLFSS